MTGADYARRFDLQLQSLPFVFPKQAAPGMKARLNPDKWSAHEHLAHLALHNEVSARRIRAMLEEDSPRLASYKAETEPAWPGLVSMSGDDLLRHFQLTREALVGIVRDCAPDQLRRAGIHYQFGAMNIGQWLDFFLLHEAHHFYAIAVANRAA
jgi:hypothetical protein